MERKNVILLAVLAVVGLAILTGVVLFLRARALPGDGGGFLSSPSRSGVSGFSATSVAPFIPLKDTPVAPGYAKDGNAPVQPVTVFPQPPRTNPSSQTP